MTAEDVRTLHAPERPEDAGVEERGHGHDSDGGQRGLGDVVEGRRQVVQRQQHQGSCGERSAGDPRPCACTLGALGPTGRGAHLSPGPRLGCTPPTGRSRPSWKATRGPLAAVGARGAGEAAWRGRRGSADTGTEWEPQRGTLTSKAPSGRWGGEAIDVPRVPSLRCCHGSWSKHICSR